MKASIGYHLLSAVRGMEKGRRNSIAQKPVSRNFDAIPVFVHLFVLYALDLAQIIGGILVDIVVQPVLIQQVQCVSGNMPVLFWARSP